jgi:hypothetical protein
MPATDNPVLGFDTYLALGTGAVPATPVDVSIYFDNVEMSVDSEELNGDTFTRRYRINADPARSIQLTGKWSSEADAFIAAIEGDVDVAYEWGPEGTAVGTVLYSGVCNVGYMIGPSANVDDFETFTLELKLTTFVRGTTSAELFETRKTRAVAKAPKGRAA